MYTYIYRHVYSYSFNDYIKGSISLLNCNLVMFEVVRVLHRISIVFQFMTLFPNHYYYAKYSFIRGSDTVHIYIAILFVRFYFSLPQYCSLFTCDFHLSHLLMDSIYFCYLVLRELSDVLMLK